MKKLFLLLVLTVCGYHVLANHWTPASASYAYNMTLTAVVQINGDEQRSAALEVGAFCGDECRGSQTLTYFAPADRYVVWLTVFGEEGDQFSFKLYDHELGAELDVDSPEVVTFNTNGYGNLSNPYVLGFTEAVAPPQPYEVVLTLGPGWTWMSYLLTTQKTLSQALVNLTPDDGDMVKGQEGFSYYDASTGQWSGSISKLVPGKGYLYLNNGTATKSFTYPAQ